MKLEYVEKILNQPGVMIDHVKFCIIEAEILSNFIDLAKSVKELDLKNVEVGTYIEGMGKMYLFLSKLEKE